MIDEIVKLRKGRTEVLFEVPCHSMAALKFEGAPPGTKLMGAFWGAMNLFPNAPVEKNAISIDDLPDGRFVFRPTSYDATVGYEVQGHPAMGMTIVFDAREAGSVKVRVEPGIAREKST